MLKLLLRLWWLRKRRNFKKRDLAFAIYFIVVYIAACVGFYFGASAAGKPVERLYAPAYVGYIIMLVFLIPDIFIKMTIKQDSTFMDDYLKTKPVPVRWWSWFLVSTNLFNLWNYLLPVILLPIFILLLSTGDALLCTIVLTLFSYANSLFGISFRRTNDKFLRFSLVCGWFFMFLQASLFTAISFWSSWAQNTVMILLALAVIAGMACFINNEENYDETNHKATKQLSFGRVTLFTMQFLGVIRAERLRNMVLLMAAIFIFDAYLFNFTSEPDDIQITIYSVLAVILPSIVLSQWTFGVEANFFQGLVSKPISVKRLLTNCYYFFLILSAASALLMIPMTFLSDMFTPLMLIASLFVAAFVNLFNIPTCLFSTRLEIFGNSFFSMQGNNLKINLYAIALLIPLGLLAGVWYLWGETAFAIVGTGLGIVSLALHRQVINFVARLFEARKYARLEAFMN